MSQDGAKRDIIISKEQVNPYFYRVTANTTLGQMQFNVRADGIYYKLCDTHHFSNDNSWWCSNEDGYTIKCTDQHLPDELMKGIIAECFHHNDGAA